MSERRTRRALLAAGTVPAVAAAVVCLFQPTSLSRIDASLYDRLVRAAGTTRPSGLVTIVDVDEQSLARVGQWPWPRSRVAALIDRLRDHGAAEVALDIMFAEPDRAAAGEGDSDAALAAALQTHDVVLGYALTFDRPDAAAPDCLRHPLPLAVVTAAPAAHAWPFFTATRAICNLPVLTMAAGASGFLNAAPDADGILRRVPLLLSFNDRIYPSLALSAVARLTGRHPHTLNVATVNRSTLELSENASLSGASPTVPLDGQSNLLVRYRGPKRTFPYVSAAEVLDGTARREHFDGRLVLVGTTALGTREVVATPLDTLFTGVEVQATVADNLIQGDFLHRPEHAVLIESLATFGSGLAIALLSARRLPHGLAAAAALAVALPIAALAAMQRGGLVFSPLYPLIALAVSAPALTIAGLGFERRRADAAGVANATSRRLMVQTLLSLVETRDQETGRHSRRTQQYTRLLAHALAAHPAYRATLTPERIDLLATLAPLHDIGKVGIADRVLLKPGPLDAAEIEEMRRHPACGRDVIIQAERDAGVRDDETLALAKELVYTHHERWDGTGYPEGLAGDAIPIAGRIVAIVDVYDAMRSPRPYHRAMTHDEVMAIIVKGRGSHFDPAVVDAFLELAPTFEALSSAPLGPDQERAGSAA
jgi:adenylate cyclase